MKKLRKNRILILIFICFIIILILIYMIKFLSIKIDKKEKEQPQKMSLGLTRDVQQEINIEYKGVTKLNSMTNDLLKSTKLIGDLKDFIIIDMQYCIDNLKEKDLSDYYKSNEDIFERKFFIVSETSFENLYKQLINYEDLKDKILFFEITENEDVSKLTLTIGMNDDKSIEGVFSVKGRIIELNF